MPVPQQIGIYTIEALIGKKPPVEVYKALDPALKRAVALKVIKTEALPDGITARAFLEKAQPARELVHPYLAWLWEVGESEGYCYLAERYVDGHSLEFLISNSGALGWQAAETILQQVAQGVEFAHRRGHAHGDIHPGSILVNPDLGAVLTDFGLSIALPQFILSSPYASPERTTRKPASPASDQYALACVLLELLSGERIKVGERAEEVLSQQIQKGAALQEGTGSIPWQTVPALRRALAADPVKRFPSIEDFAVEPSRLESLGGPERKRFEAEARRSRQKEEATRRQAEEVIRMEALEKARHELEQELHGDGEHQPLDQISTRQIDNETVQGLHESAGAAPGKRSLESQRRTVHLPPKPLRLVLSGAFVIAVSLILFWGLQRLPWQSIFPPTATPSATASSTPTLTLTPRPSWTASATLTPSSTSTATYTLIPSSSPTATQSSTVTPTPSPIPTKTRLPPGDTNREPIYQSTGGP